MFFPQELSSLVMKFHFHLSVFSVYHALPIAELCQQSEITFKIEPPSSLAGSLMKDDKN